MAGDLRRYRAHYDVTVMKKSDNPEVCLAGMYSAITREFREIVPVD